MNMRITIRAEIVIECDKTPKNDTKGRQTTLPIKGHLRPSKAGKVPSGPKVAKEALAASNGPKSARAERSDKGGQHKASCCGAIGRKAIRRLGGRCKACYRSGWL